MRLSELFIPELKHEPELIEKFLEQDKLEWAPHEKMLMGKICSHLVEIYG